MSSLYILEIKPLPKVSFANIFSHMVCSLFTLLIFPFAVQKIFILMKSNLFILSFMSLALGEQILLQGGHTEEPETYDRMFSITSHPRDAN